MCATAARLPPVVQMLTCAVCSWHVSPTLLFFWWLVCRFSLPNGPDGGGDSAQDWTAVSEALHRTLQDAPPPLQPPAPLLAEATAGLPVRGSIKQKQKTMAGKIGEEFVVGNVLKASVGGTTGSYLDVNPRSSPTRGLQGRPQPHTVDDGDSWTAVTQALGDGDGDAANRHSVVSDDSLGAEWTQLFVSGQGATPGATGAIYEHSDHGASAYISTIPIEKQHSAGDEYIDLYGDANGVGAVAGDGARAGAPQGNPQEAEITRQINSLLDMRDACDAGKLNDQNGGPMTEDTIRHQKAQIDRKIEELRAHDWSRRMVPPTPNHFLQRPQSIAADSMVWEQPSSVAPGGGQPLADPAAGGPPSHFYPGQSALVDAGGDQGVGYLSFPN